MEEKKKAKKKSNYIKNINLERQIMRYINRSNEPYYLIIETLKRCISAIKSKSKKN